MLEKWSGRAATLLAILAVGCGPASSAPEQRTAVEVSQGPLTEMTQVDIVAPYLKACDGFTEQDRERIVRVVDALEGKVDRLDGNPHAVAADEIGALQSLEVEPRVKIPERGFMTVEHSLIERVQALGTNPPETRKEMREARELGQKVAEVMPHIMALNSHLYEIQTAQIHVQVHAEICASYPLAAAIAVGNARHHNLIPASDPEGDREVVRSLLEASDRSRAGASALLADFASFQAAVAGDLEPEELAEMIEASRANLEATLTVDEDEVEEVLDLAAAELAKARQHEAELAALAEQSMRPPPPMNAATGEKVTVGKVVGSVLGVLGSLLSGNVSGVVKNVAAITPPGSPVRNALDAGEALLNGDYRTALDKATKLAPEGTPVARAREIAVRVDSRAREAKARAEKAL